MNKMQKMKAAATAAVLSLSATASADTGVLAHMKEAAAEMGKLEAGIAAIGVVMIGPVVTRKGYTIAKAMINRI